MKIIDFLKLEASEFFWMLPKYKCKDSSIDKYIPLLLSDGICVIENFIDQSLCEFLVDRAKHIIENRNQFISYESNDTDKRIYGIDRLDESFRLDDEMQLAHTISTKFYRARNPIWFQMLGNITYAPNNQGSGSGWHRDSRYSHQFKAIIYLSDVTDESGPFEYVKGSHLKESLKDAAHFLGVPNSAYRFEDAQVDHLEASGILSNRTTVKGGKGTVVLADTRGLHRGKPLLEDERWAMTRYYFERHIPKHFSSRYPALED
jgi:hypothetical protein